MRLLDDERIAAKIEELGRTISEVDGKMQLMMTSQGPHPQALLQLLGEFKGMILSLQQNMALHAGLMNAVLSALPETNMPAVQDGMAEEVINTLDGVIRSLREKQKAQSKILQPPPGCNLDDPPSGNHGGRFRRL